MEISRIRKHCKKAALLIFLFLLALVVLFLRGPYVSNMLKKAVLPEVQAATGYDVIASKMLINIFPFYVEARDVSVSDKGGPAFLEVERVKVYLGLSEITRKRVDSRVLLFRPQMRADRARLDEVLEKIRKYEREEEGALRFRVKTAAVKDGEFSYRDEEVGYALAADGADVEVVFRERAEARFSLKEFAYDAPGKLAVKAAAKGAVVIFGDKVEIKDIKFTSSGSELKGKGVISRAEADLDVEAKLLVSTIKEMFGLKKSGQGALYAQGKLKVAAWDKKPFMDLKVGGEFPLETLLEFLRADKKGAFRGFVNFEGKLIGDVPELEGSAVARVTNAEFYGVAVEKARSRVTYKNNKLEIAGKDAKLYGGRADVEVSLTLPGAKPYSVDVVFKNADSAPVFALIGISAFGFPDGKVDGEFHTSGLDFAPEGGAVYRALEAGENFIGRVRSLSGSYKIKDNILSLSGFKAATGSSRVAFSGKLDLFKKVLDIKGLLRTDDVNDLAMPYAKGLKGAGEYDWTLRGTTNEPEISGRVLFGRVSFNDYFFGDVEGEVSYRKELLNIKELHAESGDKRHSARGTLRFSEAERLFDVRNPVYDIALAVENGDLRELAYARGLGVPVEGNFAADLAISGSGPLPEIAGSAAVLDADVYGRPVSSASFGFSYHDRELRLKDASIAAFGSTTRLDGMVAGDGRFEFKVSSEGFRLSDLFPEKLPVDYKVKLDAGGSGTFREPDIRADFMLSDGSLRGKHMGGGWVQTSLKGREVLLEARLIDGNVSLTGKAALEGNIPWSAEVNMDRGRYDFLLGAILRKLPEDLLLSMSGSVSMHGDKDNINASALIKRLNLNLFGQGFMNRSDIAFSVQKRTFSLSEVELRSGNAFIKLGGSIVLGSSYDITVEGSSSLAPLGGFTDRIETVRGDADFIFTARGDWEGPSITGGVSVHDGVLGFRGFLQRLSAVEAFIYVDDNRVVIREFNAKTGGGNVEANGVIQLKGLEFEKFLVNTLVDNVSLSLSKGFDMNVGGELVLRGSADSQVITGDLQINRARYTKRIDWKSWVLFREKKAPKVKRGWFDKVGLNVRVYGKERIVIDNNLARAPLKVDIIVGGTIGSPRLLGRVEANEGKVYFRNSELDILSVTADFVDPESNSPIIRVQAETTIREYHIWLTLDGRAGRFDLTLASDPPLSEEEEILALLTLGERKVFEGMESDIGAAEAASFLTGKFQDVIEERLTDITGLDRVQIDPYVSGASQSVTPKITVSKRLMGERLFVTFSSAVGAETEEELKLEYFLGDNVSLLGGQDDRGSIGGDIKFRFRFK